MPAADEVGRLQRGGDEECRLFQHVAEQGHYAGRTQPSNTRQGIYAAAPSGVLLGSINSRDPEAVAGMLLAALQRWEELPREARLLSLPPGQAPARWELRRPADGLVLRVAMRDVERTEQPRDWRAFAWNQDFAWFTREEVLSVLPPGGAAGAEHAWPAELVQRLARCHLVDAVRGQVPAFRREEIEQAELTTRIVAADEEAFDLELIGRTRAVARGRWPVLNFGDTDTPGEQERGFEAELCGRARFDRRAQRFTTFELVALGTRWGGTQFNGRGDDLGRAPIGVSLTLAGDGPAERVAPALIWEYGWPPPGAPAAARPGR